MTTLTTEYDGEFEQRLEAMVERHQAGLKAAQQKEQEARHESDEQEAAVAHWLWVLNDYRKEHDLSVLENGQYADLTPTEMFLDWADKHDGTVVVKELVDYAIGAGLFNGDRRLAHSAFPKAAKRKNFEKVRRGEYKRRRDEDRIRP